MTPVITTITTSEQHHHHDAGICHLLRLPPELRDMIWNYATRGNVYDARQFRDQRKKAVTYPTSAAAMSHDCYAVDNVPNTLLNGYTFIANRFIFDESLPTLIRNTDFIFHSPTELEAFMQRFSLVRRNITSLRIHDAQSSGTTVSKTFAKTLNGCPKLMSLTYFLHEGFIPNMRQKMVKSRAAGTATEPTEAFVQLRKVKGLTDFHLFLVDVPAGEHFPSALKLRDGIEGTLRKAVLQRRSSQSMHDDTIEPGLTEVRVCLGVKGKEAIFFGGRTRVVQKQQ
jgi:hypothetical protein